MVLVGQRVRDLDVCAFGHGPLLPTPAAGYRPGGALDRSSRETTDAGDTEPRHNDGVAARILAACSLGGASHLNPLVPFLAAARGRGHETLVIGPPALGDMVRRTGFAFHAGGEPDEAQIAPIREQLPVVPREEASILGNRELFGRLATTAMLPAMTRLCDDWQPDLVLREPCEYASAVVACERGIPTAQVAIGLADVEAGSITYAAPALEARRDGLTDELRASPYLTRFPASVDPTAFATTARYHEHQADARGPLPDWWPGLDGPLVYLTFGTVLGHMSLAPGVFRAALDAVAGLPMRVLLTLGHRLDPDALGAIPANVQVKRWVDQADVFAVADLVVCHGGSGTTYGALAAGLPLVLVPIFADQFENATRVGAAGAAITVAGPDAIADAIRSVLAASAYRDRARAIAAEVAATPLPGEVLDEVLADAG
jgi:UDP:flavonoid glycosyltransferase YjiC (YdhE family)